MRLTRLIAALACAAGLACAGAHETETPAAQLVWRHTDHYTLTLHLDLARALHLTLDPQAQPAEFLAVASAMSPQGFAAAWERAVAQWSRECTLDRGGARTAATRWRWPSAAQAQSLLRERLMHALTATGPGHPGLLAQAQGEFRPATADRGTVRLHLPAALRPLTLTSYRPRQQWVSPGDAPIPLSF